MKLALLLLSCAVLALAGSVERVRNDKVVCTEYTLKPGETATLSASPAVVVYFDDGILQSGGDKTTVHRGEVLIDSGRPKVIRNAGTDTLKFVRTEFLTAGSDELWGHTGLAPNYKVLSENQLSRVYEIRIPAGEREPQHTHHARVVVCLSGAVLKHIMPDGREEPSTLKTGDVVFRPAATHVGVNLGKTDLWVIAIEPK